MKKTKIISAFLSLALGITSLSAVPVTVNASTENLTAVSDENKVMSSAFPVTLTTETQAEVSFSDVTTAVTNDTDDAVATVTTTAARCVSQSPVLSTTAITDSPEYVSVTKVYSSGLTIDLTEAVIDYDHSAIAVGDDTRVYFHHPDNKTKLTIESVTTDYFTKYMYSEDNDYFTLIGLHDGVSNITIKFNELRTESKATFDIVPKGADVIKDIDVSNGKTMYSKGESLDISGLKGHLVHKDGTSEMISLDALQPANYLVLTESENYWMKKPEAGYFNDHTDFDVWGSLDAYEAYLDGKNRVTFDYNTDKKFPNLPEGRYVIYLGRTGLSLLDIEDKRYYVERNFGYLSDPHAGYAVYIEDEETPERFVQLKPSKVTKALYGTEDGFEIEGLKQKLYIDEDKPTYKYWNMPHIDAGDTISGVLYLNEDNKVINGEISIDLKPFDANCDDEVSMADAVIIMQAIANPDKYGENGTHENHITAQGRKNADNDGDGMTNADALAIQKKLLGLN